jgi:hypothetical protein
MKTVYHYTTLECARQIVADGAIRANDGVVQLTMDPDWRAGARVRFTVKMPTRDVHTWRDWLAHSGVERPRALQLIRDGGGALVTNRWRVVIGRPITWPRWVEVLDRRTGEQLWIPMGRRDAS